MGTIPLGYFVYGHFIAVGALTVGAVGTALFFGLKGKGNAVWWRGVKLASSLVGVMGILFLLLTFENLARTGIADGTSPAHVLGYLDARSKVMHKMSVVCAREGSNPGRACNDLQHIDNVLAVHILDIRDAKPLPNIRHSWQ